MATSTEQMEATAKAVNQTEQMASQAVGEASIGAGQATALAPVQAPQTAEPIEAIGAQVDANGQPIESQVAADSLVDSEEEEIVEALLGEGNPDELPANAEGVLLAQADTSSEEAPAESGEGSADAEGEAAGSGAMGAGQIGLIAAGAVGIAAASDSSSSSSTSSLSTETEGNTFALNAMPDQRELIDGVTVAAVKQADLEDALPDSDLITIKELAPVLTTTERNDGVKGGEGFATDGNDTVITNDFDMLGAVLDLGAGSADTLEIVTTGLIDATGPKIGVGIETVKISNQTQIDADDENTVGQEGVIVSLQSVPDLNKLIVDESTNAEHGLDIVGVKNNAEVTLRGNFNQDTTIDFANSGAMNVVFDDYFQNAGELEIALDGSVLNLSSVSPEGGVLNAIDTGAFATGTDGISNLVELNIDGDTNLELLGSADGSAGMEFRQNSQAKIDASDFTGEKVSIDVAAHSDVTFTSSDADDQVRLKGDDINGNRVIKVDAQMGAGSNTIVLDANDAGVDTTNNGNVDAAVPTTVSADSTLTAVDGTITLEVEDSEGDTGGVNEEIDIRELDVTNVDNVLFTDHTRLVLSEAQLDTIGVSNFATSAFTNDNGQLVIADVDGNTDLDLSNVDNGDLLTIRTVDGADVTLSDNAVLGNLQGGVGTVEILAESDDASLTMSLEQFGQLAGDQNNAPSVNVVGAGGAVAPGNDPNTEDPFEAQLIITGVEDTAAVIGDSTETLDLANVEAEVVPVVRGTSGADTIDLDAINAGAGSVAEGLAGDDTLTADQEGSTLIGGAGADTMNGTVGSAAADIFVIASNNDHAEGETIDGDDGNDTIRFTSTTADETLELNADVQVEAAEISDADGRNTGATNLNIDASAVIDDNGNGAEDIDLTGNAGDNVLTGSSGANTVNGGAGTDTLVGNAGDDTLAGGEGNDTLTGGAGTDRFTVASGTDSITDLSGTAGAADDLIVSNGATAQATVSENFTAESETENSDSTAVLTFAEGVTSVDMRSATVTDAANDGYTITAAGRTEAVTIVGSAAADTLAGGDANDTITGGAGADALSGGAGDDTYVFVANDIATGETLTDTAGTTTLTMAGAVATVDFSNLADGDGGSLDQVDRLVVEEDQQATFTGAQLDGEDVTVNEDGAGTSTLQVNVDGTADLSNLTFTAFDGNTVFTDGTDVIDINGTDGTDDTITGTTLGDTITGGTGSDTIDGDAGADSITGGAGADTLTGGAGADTFAYSAPADFGDTITDFAEGAAGDDDTLAINVSVTGTGFNTETDAAALDFGANEINVIQGDSSNVGSNMTAAEVEAEAIDAFGNIEGNEDSYVALTADTDAESTVEIYQVTANAAGDDVASVTHVVSLEGVIANNLATENFDIV